MSEKLQPSVALSTIGMTAYNWIATRNGPARLPEILAGVHDEWNASVSADDLGDALVELVTRNRLTMNDDGQYDVRDPRRRVVVSRDRKGDGWEHWAVANKPAKPKTTELDEVLP